MMNIMIRRIILRDPLQRIPRQPEPAMIVHDLQTAGDEEEDALAEVEARGLVGEGGAKGVHEEAFEGVVVLAAEGVGGVEEVVA